MSELYTVFKQPVPVVKPLEWFNLHDGQREVCDAIAKNQRSETPASIIELICSRGWGKTAFIAGGVLIPFLEYSQIPVKVMWVAPSYMTCMSVIDDFFKGINELTGEPLCPQFDDEGNQIWQFSHKASGPTLTWWNGCEVVFRSADAPESIVSKGFNLIIVDEAALIQDRVFRQQILGTARRGNVKIFLITTPRGKKHFTHEIFLKGQDPSNPMYLSFKQPYTKNPIFNPTLAKLIKDLPDWIYRQEYMAEFIDDGDTVFKGLYNAVYGPSITFPDTQQEWSKPVEDLKDELGRVTKTKDQRNFIVSADLAKSSDFTVITVMCMDTGDIVYYKRVNKTDYREIIKMIEFTCKSYNNAPLIFDATGVGNAVADMLRNVDVAANPFTFTNESKGELITKLALAIEYAQISIPNIETIVGELSAFTYSLTKTQKISYSAPPGMHDDCVMSIAMANLYRLEHSMLGSIASIDDVLTINARGGAPNSFREFMENDDD